MRKPKQQKPHNDLSRSLTPFDPNQTLIAGIEMGQKNWLVAGIIPGVERQPLKKLEPDEYQLLKFLGRWQAEAKKTGHEISRIAVAFETGRDGFWLARWLRVHGIEAHVIHAASVAVSREHRRAKTDRLDTEQLKRAFFGWLRGEREHCKMAVIPTPAEEDAKLVVNAFDRHAADCIVVEVNFGAAMVEAVVQAAASNAKMRVGFKSVTASRGKVVRAEPIATLWSRRPRRQFPDHGR